MAVTVTMPQLGESVTEGIVTRWHKNVGDEVTVDEPLLEVSTDKVDTEIPAPTSGVLLEIHAVEDEVIEVGGLLATIGDAGDSPSDAPAPAAESNPDPDLVSETTAEPEPAPEPVTPGPAAPGTATPAPTPEPTADGSDDQPAPYASPVARRLAREMDVDLSQVSATGEGNRVTKADVRAAAGSAAPTPPTPPTPTSPSPAAAPATSSGGRGEHTEPMSRLRRVIAERMVESLHVAAQLTTVIEVDVTAIARLRDKAKAGFAAREGVQLTFLPFFARASLEALKLYPQVNATINSDDHTVTYFDAAHLGVAVDTEKGLLVPVIRDAGDLTLAGLARRVADLAERTRVGRLSPDELSGGTFTVTNTGSRGALFDTPIINQPQVAILGTGAVVKRPVVVTDSTGVDAIAVRHMMYLALTYDHRLIDGADAARFLAAIKTRLEEAQFESELGV